IGAGTASRLRTLHKSKQRSPTVRLNTQRPCPPRGPVPVNQGVVGGFFTLPARFAFSQGCDCPSYVAAVYSINGHQWQGPVSPNSETVPEQVRLPKSATS